MAEKKTVNVHVRVIECKDLTAADVNGLLASHWLHFNQFGIAGYSDPFVVVKMADDKAQQKTKVCEKNLNPVFNTDFTFPASGALTGTLSAEVFDMDIVKQDFIGMVKLNLSELKSAKSASRWYSLLDKKGEKLFGGSINLALVVDESGRDPKSAGFEGYRAGLLNKVVKDRDEREAKEAKSAGTISLFIGTWNVGNKPPPDAEELRHWVKPKHDIYVFGAQECKYDQRKEHKSCADDWAATLQATVGKEYTLLRQHNLMEIRLVVFARTSLLPVIGNVAASTEATGLADVVGNKGGVCISMNVRDLNVGFVNSHLAAHQHKTAHRNADVKQIIQGLRLGVEKMDVLNMFHHVFWCGDLNYRLNYGGQGDAKSPTKEQFEDMVAKIGEGGARLTELFATDQLASEMKAGRVFAGFQEGKMGTFKPTFKVQRKEPKIAYDEERSPAWCDRVLWHSFPGFAGGVRQTALGSAEQVLTSDHKPVFATFDVDLYDLPSAVDPSLGACTITIKQLRATSALPAGDMDGKSDPFVRFYAPFLAKPVQTAVKPKTLTPDWGDSCPPLPLTVNNKRRLERSFIMVKVLDKDLATASCLAYSRIGLAEAVGGSPVPFKLSLEQGGLPAGTLEGVLQMTWAKA